MSQVVVSGLLVSYVTSGSGPVVLWLHGWGSSKETFGEITKDIGGYKHVCLDLPGFGATQAPKDVWGLEEYAQFIADFCSKLDIKPVTLVGHSNGGSLAIKAVSSGILSPKKLVLLASAGIRSQLKQRARKSVMWVVAKTGKIATLPLPRNARKKLRVTLYKTAGSDRLLSPELDATFRKTTAEDVCNASKKITIPTLLIYGDNDTDTPSHFGELYNSAIKGSELSVVNAGHFVHIDAKTEVITLIKSFLKRSK